MKFPDLAKLIRFLFRAFWMRFVVVLYSLLEPSQYFWNPQRRQYTMIRSQNGRPPYFAIVLIVFGGVTTLCVYFFKLFLSAFRNIPNSLFKTFRRHPGSVTKVCPKITSKYKIRSYCTAFRENPQEYQCYHLRNQAGKSSKRQSDSEESPNSEQSQSANNTPEEQPLPAPQQQQQQQPPPPPPQQQRANHLRDRPPPVHVELDEREMEISYDGSVQVNFNQSLTDGQVPSHSDSCGIRAHKRRKTEDSASNDLQLEGLGQRLLQSIPLASTIERVVSSASNSGTEPISGLQMLIESVKFVESASNNDRPSILERALRGPLAREDNLEVSGESERTEKPSQESLPEDENKSGESFTKKTSKSFDPFAQGKNLELKLAELSLDDNANDLDVPTSEFESISLREPNEVAQPIDEVKDGPSVQSATPIKETKNAEVLAPLSETTVCAETDLDATKLPMDNEPHSLPEESTEQSRHILNMSSASYEFVEDTNNIPISPVEITITDSSEEVKSEELNNRAENNEVDNQVGDKLEASDESQQSVKKTSNQVHSRPIYRLVPPSNVHIRRHPNANQNSVHFFRPSSRSLTNPPYDDNGNVEFVYRRRSESDLERGDISPDRNNNNHHSTSSLPSAAECEAAEALIDLKGCEEVFIAADKCLKNDQDLNVSLSSDASDTDKDKDK